MISPLVLLWQGKKEQPQTLAHVQNCIKQMKMSGIKATKPLVERMHDLYLRTSIPIDRRMESDGK